MSKESKDKKEFTLGRRDFLKTGALAVLGSTIPFTHANAKEIAGPASERSGRYKKRNKKLLCLSESPDSYKGLFDSIKSNNEIGLNVNVMQVSLQDPQRLMEAIQGNDAGIILVCLPSFTFGFGRLAQHLGNLEIPILLLSPNNDLMMVDANLAAELRAKGANVRLAGSDEKIIELLKAEVSPGILEGKKAVVYGQPFESTSVPAHNLTSEYVYEHTGVRLEFRPLDELVTLLKKTEKAEAEEDMRKWKKEASKVDNISDSILLDECRLYILLRSIMEKENLSALSIDCLSFTFGDHILPLPCLAFARLRDEGYTASCEADICGMLTSMVLEKISGKSSYFANVASVNADRSTITMRHCISPLKILGKNTPHLPYKLDDYHGLGIGLVPKVEFPDGLEVTTGAFTKDLKNFVLWPGKICNSSEDTDNYNFGMRTFCSNKAEIVIRDFESFYQNIAGIHHVMVAGNYVKQIESIMLRENIKIIGPLDRNVS